MFRQQNPYDDIIEKATAETLTAENWELNLNVCDRIQREGEQGARDAVSSLTKRLTHKNANVVLYALTLAEAMVKNCGIALHREFASRSFTSTLVKVLNDISVHESVKRRILELIQQWVLEFRHDTSLGLLEETYQQLRAQSFHFPNPQKPEKKELTDAERRREEEELELALALSLSANEARSQRTPAPTSTSASSSYSSYGRPSQPTTTQTGPPLQRPQVRALYDFVASEPGELSFARGDVINVIDSSYKDWWKGESKGRTGIFPVNYVEKILPQPDASADAENEANVLAEAKKVERLLQLLNSLDPRTDNISDNEELMQLYNSTLAIRPKLVRLIEKYNQKKEELLTLNDQFGKARTTYNAMMESSVAKYSSGGQGYYQQQQHQHQHQQQPMPHYQHPQSSHGAPPAGVHVMPDYQHPQTSHGAPPAGIDAMPAPNPYYTGTSVAPVYSEAVGGGYYHATPQEYGHGQGVAGQSVIPAQGQGQVQGQVAEGYYHQYQQPQQQQQQQQQQAHAGYSYPSGY